MVCQQSPPIFHILFTENSFFFFRENVDECLTVKQILSQYEIPLRQDVNLQKFELFFSPSFPTELQNYLQDILGIQNKIEHSRYMGLPSLIGKRKKEVLSFMRDSLLRWVQGWSHKYLSKVGKEVLFNSFAQSFPTFCMSVFQISTSLCEELQKLMNNFWWGSKKDSRKNLHQKQLEALCKRKEKGAMGFRYLPDLNLVMLGKQLWRIIQTLTSLVTQVIMAKYSPYRNISSVMLGTNPSYTQRSLFAIKDLVRNGMRWVIGTSRDVYVQRNPWLSKKGDHMVRSPCIEGLKDLKVCDLMCENRQNQDTTMVRIIFMENEAYAILYIPLSMQIKDDRRFQAPNKTRKYIVKYIYFYLQDVSYEQRLEVKICGNSLRKLRC